MCGISGKVDFEGKEIPEELIRRMNAALSHRGPDDEGIYINNSFAGHGQKFVSVGLGHKRLSIIDLSRAGHQPMSNESKTVWIVFNGEVYGYQKLKKDLEQQGHQFSSNSDCEVIIHLYEQEGIECIKKLNGMFAFALWDSRIQALYLVRDRVGIKPLVYFWNGMSLLFASEIKSILCDSGVSREIDWAALNLYLTYNYIGAPATIFKNIKKLEPGCYLTARNKSITINHYWDVGKDLESKGIKGRDIEIYKKKIRELLEDAVRMQLVADVPLGAFLSGGIDSSIIVGLMSKVAAKPVNTYTIGYKDMPLFDETRFAREVAKFNHTNHHEIFLTSKDILNVIPDALASFDEPFADSSAIPTYVVSRETKKHVKVALSGDGGDELFAGYRMYAGEYLYSRYRWIPRVFRKKLLEPLLLALPDSRDQYILDHIRRAKKFVKGTHGKFEERFFAWNEIFSRDIREGILKKKFQGSERMDFDAGKEMACQMLGSFSSDPVNRMLYADLKNSLPNDMLTKVDWMSMKNALEVRVPFLDHRLVEYSFQLPGDLKLRGRRGKYILIEACRDLLPQSIHKRTKWGFEMPISKWLKSDLKYLVDEYLSRQKIEQQGVFNYKPIKRLIADLFLNRSDTSWQLWNLIVFQAWHSKYFGEQVI